MKRLALFLLLFFLSLPLLFPAAVPARPPEAEDKTLSPFFFVKGDDPQVDQLPLKSTAARVRIAGVIADVLVTQVYKNEGREALEALYVFPASTRAAVYGLKMTVGKRVVEARIKKRDEARKEYEQAREQGQTASLLEQQRPNVFQMNVANILPGDEIKVELQYTELLVPTDRVYEFVYPTVVGPRYANRPEASAPASEQWIKSPYHRQGAKATYRFELQVTLEAGLPVQDLSSPSHKISAQFPAPSRAEIALDPAEAHGGNRDFILRYRLDGRQVQSGLLLCEGEKENFFLLQVQPPRRVAPGELPGREYIFIVDVSGSMHGFPLEISKKLLKDLIGRLRPTDRFNVLLFSGGSTVLAEQSLAATPENLARAVSLIERQRGGGGTELLPALKRALALERAAGFARTVVIVTDGYVAVEEEAFDLVRHHLGRANMFAFGIGSSVNRHIIEGLAHVGQGEPFVITKPEEAPAQAERFRSLIQSPVLTGIQVRFEGFEVYDVEPPQAPDLFAEKPVVVFGKWRGKPRGKVFVSGQSGEGAFQTVVEVGGVKAAPANSALRFLWARHKITLLADYNRLRSDDRRVREVTELGLRYHLLTAYTSFVAVDSEVRNVRGKATPVQQPLPLPQGVSDQAVGGKALMTAAAPGAMPGPRLAKVAADEGRGKAAEKKEEREQDAVAVKDLKGAGNMDTVPVRRLIQQHLEEIRGCLPPEQRRGTLTVTIRFQPDGKIREVVPVKPQRSGLEKCLTELFRKWTWPTPRDGRPGELTLEINLG
jgi:Ca-activated chloride channel family protein